MTPLEILRAARLHGVDVLLAHDNLRLVARMEPPRWVMDALRQHKAAIIALLRPDHHGWTEEDRLVAIEERAAILEYEHGLERAEAEARAREAERGDRCDGAAARGKCPTSRPRAHRT